MTTGTLMPLSENVFLLSVVIVNYRTPQYVLDCLDTLLPELAELNAVVVVVDNHSGDDSFEQITAWVSQCDAPEMVKVVGSGANKGFAWGNNVGIRACRARAYLLLNSDTLMRPGSVKALLDSAEKYPQAGLLSPRLEWPDGAGQESCFRSHSPVSELIGAAQTGIVDILLQNHLVPMPIQVEIAYPEWTSFACVLIKDQVFQDVGLLDEGYFMYFEDVEFCHRARKAGWQVMHNPEARVVHLRGGSSPVKTQTRLKKRVPRYYYESRARFFCQIYGWWGLTAANILWLLGRTVSKIRQTLGRLDKAAVARQWLDIWTNWLNPMKPYTHPGLGKRKQA